MTREAALNQIILVHTAFYKDAYAGDLAAYRKSVVSLRNALRAIGFTTEEINANWWIDVHEKAAVDVNETLSN